MNFDLPLLFLLPLQVESVELALNVLDGSDVRGKTISVQRAEFQMRGEYNPALKPRMKKQEKEKMKKIQEKWADGWEINIVCGCLDSEQFALDAIQTNRYCKVFSLNWALIVFLSLD